MFDMHELTKLVTDPFSCFKGYTGLSVERNNNDCLFILIVASFLKENSGGINNVLFVINLRIWSFK